MISKNKIKRLQKRILSHGDYNYQLNKSVEELKELLVELQSFIFFNSGGAITHRDLSKPCGNIQKEIEDVGQIIDQLRMMFNRTPEQRKMSRICRKRIVKQMKDYVKSAGIK